MFWWRWLLRCPPGLDVRAARAVLADSEEMTSRRSDCEYQGKVFIYLHKGVSLASLSHLLRDNHFFRSFPINLLSNCADYADICDPNDVIACVVSRGPPTGSGSRA